MPESEKQSPDPLSKTQRKKEMHALQELGVRLIGLSDSRLAKLPLSDELLQIIRDGRKLKTHESIRRHAQYLGKKMRSADAEAILKALKKIDK